RRYGGDGNGAVHRDRPAGRRSGADRGPLRAGPVDRGRRTRPAAAGRAGCHPAPGIALWPFRAARCAARRTLRTGWAAAGQRLPAALLAQARLARLPGPTKPTRTSMTNATPELRDSTEAEARDSARPASAGTSTSAAGGEVVQLPADALPILPIRNNVLFPG